MASSSPLLNYDKIEALGVVGGYDNNVRLSDTVSVLLLSALVAIRQQWMWQLALLPIDNSEWVNINELLDTANWELMRNNVGSVFSTISLNDDDSVILMDGTSVLQSDYPILATVVPASWLSGLDILIPDMQEVGLFGSDVPGNVGDMVGENEHQLTVSEMPEHTHIQDSHSHSYNNPIVTPALGGAVPAAASVVVPTPAVTGSTSAVNQNTGGDGSHNNIQESLNVFWYLVGR